MTLEEFAKQTIENFNKEFPPQKKEGEPSGTHCVVSVMHDGDMVVSGTMDPLDAIKYLQLSQRHIATNMEIN